VVRVGGERAKVNPPLREVLPPDPSQTGAFALEAVSGASFPVAVKLIVTAMMLALLGFGSTVLMQPAAVPAPDWTATEWLFIAVLVAVIGSGYWAVMGGRTHSDGQCLEQTWLRRKKVRLADITQVKLISVPGLNWLIVPRLVVRTGYGLTTFHAGDGTLFSRFKLLAHGR
jgi:hypothetical protein